MISFVIPAHNEELLLPATLAALHRAGGAVGGRYEIIVVDDGSTDRTQEVAVEAGARVAPIARRQIAAARNAGARAAGGEIIVFVDADTIVPVAALREALEAIRAGAASGGALIEIDGRVPGWARATLAATLVLYRIARLSGGCFMFCTREAFDASGGFDETLFGGEEVIFALALQRVGRFELIRERVITSGRKLRAYSGREILGTLARLAIRGKRGVRSREGLEIWYGPRREDPG